MSFEAAHVHVVVPAQYPKPMLLIEPLAVAESATPGPIDCGMLSVTGTSGFRHCTVDAMIAAGAEL